MKAKTFYLIPVLVTLLISCAKNTVMQQQQYPFVEINQCAQTTINNTSINICFDSLISDSRCPINAICVWQGEATVQFSMTVNGQQQTFKLSTADMLPQFRNDTTVFGYHVRLVDVKPYPGDPSQSPKTAEVSITQ
jgi:hypothetical protein